MRQRPTEGCASPICWTPPNNSAALVGSRECSRDTKWAKLSTDVGCGEAYTQGKRRCELHLGQDQKNRGWAQHHSRRMAKAWGELPLICMASNPANSIKNKSYEILALPSRIEGVGRMAGRDRARLESQASWATCVHFAPPVSLLSGPASYLHLVRKGHSRWYQYAERGPVIAA